MSYAIYKTDALIMRTIPGGEANWDVVFLTKDLGKITARAQGSRKIESKMRMHIKKYNHVAIDTVRGKNIWRLTGISQVAPHATFQEELLLKPLHRAIRLAEFLIRGEDPHPELFDFFVSLLEYADMRTRQSAGADESLASEKAEPVTKNESEGLEIWSVIGVLQMLGYWHDEALSGNPSKEMLEDCFARKKELVAKINDAIEATQII